ncbi:50S ribosomal protein L3 [Methanofollis formosanus]|uniref:Large ribosomal subunit protein uL3 n=1 Tax=Methanofollis formosanus TaxID=299308 RepID=A0A8G1A2D3_9EURY|nr:50S ribosomal protein L3 [Methanofollis formosanus]QYZ79104.1 50S ribosomal protein L3 [Methanofollis formosanus]
MPNIHRPRRGSLAYSPRKRAKSQVPKYQSWPRHEGEPMLQAIAGYKVGMTHVVAVDDHKSSPTEGREIMVPVTIIEVPVMKVAAVRAYVTDTYGKHPLTEAWAENLDAALAKRVTLPKTHDREATLKTIQEAVAAGQVTDIFVLMYTQPAALSGVPKKVPELMETRIDGGSMEDRLNLATSLLGTEVDPLSLFSEGQYVDVTAVTRGKGTEGPVKRWGIQVRKRKHSRGGKKRHIGNLGPWTPHHVRWQVPQMGQMGYQQRTEFNKRILKASTEGAEIVPEGGFLHYGVVRNSYIMIKGSVPGPVKRLVRIRPAIRQGEHEVRAPAVNFVSLESKQG